MGISGNLKTMELAELLQWLSQGQKTGTLVVDNGLVEKRVFFRQGKIISSASSDPKEHLGHFLVSHGFIDERQLAAAVARQEQERSLLGRVLVGLGAIGEADLDRMLRLKAEEAIYALFDWLEGEFRFVDDELPTYDMVPLALDVTGLVLEASRRLDELKRIRSVIPSIHCVPVLVGAELAATPGLDEATRRILEAIDDDRTVEEIALHTHASDYFVCETLYPFVAKGKVKIVRPRGEAGSSGVPTVEVRADVLVQRAQAFLKDSEFESAIRYLKAARSLEPDNAEVARAAEGAESIIRRGLEKEGLVGTAVPELTLPLHELTKIKVGPKAGFLLSRMDGSYDVASILKISPITPLEALLELRSLLAAGHVRLRRR